MRTICPFWIVLVVVVLGAGLATIASAEAPALFSPAVLPQGLSQPDDPTIIRANPVVVNFDVLLANAPDKPADHWQPVLLNLFDDVSFEAVLNQEAYGWGGAQVRSGYVEGVENSEVILVFQDGVMAGNITVPDAFYQVRYVGEGVHAIYQIDQRAFPEELPPVIPQNCRPIPASPLPETSLELDSCSTVDMMVVYTGRGPYCRRRNDSHEQPDQSGRD